MTLRKPINDEYVLDAFRSGFDTLSLSRIFNRHEAEIEAAIHRARTAEYERRTARAVAA